MAEQKRASLDSLKHEGKPLKGILKYPRLNEADYKFKKDTGEYSTKMIVSGEIADAIRPQIEAVAKQALAEAKAKLEEKVASGKGEEKGKAKKKLAELKLADLPMKPVYNDDGDETGEYELHFKMNASYKNKKEEVVKISPGIFDAKGTKLVGKAIPSIWGGTVARVSAELQPWFMESENKAGCKLRLSGVQVIELKTGGGKSAGDHGFGEEEGYEGAAARDSELSDEATETTGGTDGVGEEEF